MSKVRVGAKEIEGLKCARVELCAAKKNTLQECFAFSSTLKNILVFMGFHGRNLAQASIQSMLFAKDTKPPDVVKMFVSNTIIYGPKPETLSSDATPLTLNHVAQLCCVVPSLVNH